MAKGSKASAVKDIEWLNRAAQAAKEQGDIIAFECWRRAYLNAQAAWYFEKRVDKRMEMG